MAVLVMAQGIIESMMRSRPAAATLIAALVLAHEPLLTPAELRQRLMSTSVFPAGSSQRLIEAGGVVNANNALQNAAAHDYDDKSAWTPPVSQSAGDSSGQTAAAGALSHRERARVKGRTRDAPLRSVAAGRGQAIRLGRIPRRPAPDA